MQYAWGKIVKPDQTEVECKPFLSDGIDQWSWAAAYPPTPHQTGTWVYMLFTHEIEDETRAEGDWLREIVSFSVAP
jgi:hypothetical protein